MSVIGLGLASAACGGDFSEKPAATEAAANTFMFRVEPGPDALMPLVLRDGVAEVAGIGAQRQELVVDESDYTLKGKGTFDGTRLTAMVRMTALSQDVDEPRLVITKICKRGTLPGCDPEPAVTFEGTHWGSGTPGSAYAYADLKQGAGAVAGSARQRVVAFDPTGVPFDFVAEVQADAIGTSLDVVPDEDDDTFNTELDEHAGDDCDDTDASVIPLIDEWSLPAQNYATQGTATQSSTAYTGWGGGVAKAAIDGNRDGVYWNGSVTHTALHSGPSDAWWVVDLGFEVKVRSIRIFNRTDCCTDRLSQLNVLWSQRPMLNNASTAALVSDPANSSAFVRRIRRGWRRSLGGETARYVRVQIDSRLNSPQYLSLAEVEVTGRRKCSMPAALLRGARDPAQQTETETGQAEKLAQ